MTSLGKTLYTAIDKSLSSTSLRELAQGIIDAADGGETPEIVAKRAEWVVESLQENVAFFTRLAALIRAGDIGGIEGLAD